MNNFYLYRAMGDIIYSIPAIRAYGGGDIYTGISITHYNILKPLIEIQEGITGFYHESQGLPPNFINLEESRYIRDNGMHLCESFARMLNVQIEYKNGWLTLPELPLSWMDYSVINVTPRYRDKIFSYKKEIRFLKENIDSYIWFLGLYEEYAEFVEKYGDDRIWWRQCDDYLQAAYLIRGAKYFTGTQSSLLAIAEGLGRTYRYERSPFPFFDNCRIGTERETILNNNTRKIHLAISRIKEVYRNFKS